MDLKYDAWYRGTHGHEAIKTAQVCATPFGFTFSSSALLSTDAIFLATGSTEIICKFKLVNGLWFTLLQISGFFLVHCISYTIKTLRRTKPFDSRLR